MGTKALMTPDRSTAAQLAQGKCWWDLTRDDGWMGSTSLVAPCNEQRLIWGHITLQLSQQVHILHLLSSSEGKGVDVPFPFNADLLLKSTWLRFWRAYEIFTLQDISQSLLKSMETSPLTSHGFQGNVDFKNLTGPKLQSLPGFLEVSVIFLPRTYSSASSFSQE